MKEYVVLLEPNLWLAGYDVGDPTRTTRVENARRFDSELKARIALAKARVYHLFVDAEVQDAK